MDDYKVDSKPDMCARAHKEHLHGMIANTNINFSMSFAWFSYR